MNARDREECRSSLAAELLTSHGILQLRVSGASMLPTLWPGDLLSIESLSFQDIQPGDLALYHRAGRFFVHRVIEKSGEFLLTRGDCMTSNDDAVAPSDLLGRVVKILRGTEVIQPQKALSLPRALYAQILRRSDLCTRIALRLHAMRSAHPSIKLTSERAAW